MEKPLKKNAPRKKKNNPTTEHPYQNFFLEDLPGETWLDLPGFDGEYEISSLGRIKSLRRWRGCGADSGYYTTEKIRRQHARIGKNEYLNELTYTVGSTLKRNGKSFSTSTARYVYCAFVEPFDLEDKNTLVSYKDKNGRNLHYENLFLTNRSELCKEITRADRRHGHFEDTRIPVRQLTITGKLIAKYPSFTAAEKATGIALSGIASCVAGSLYQFKGFRWESPLKKKPAPIPKPEPAQLFNEYLWRKLGNPKTSRTKPIAALNLNPENLDGESWKPITGCEGAFLISNFGRVKGLPRFKNGRLRVWTKGMIKRLIPDGNQKKPNSCLMVQLVVKGKKIQRSVSRLVYYHFVRQIDMDDKKIKIKYRNRNFYDLHYKNLIA